MTTNIEKTVVSKIPAARPTFKTAIQNPFRSASSPPYHAFAFSTANNKARLTDKFDKPFTTHQSPNRQRLPLVKLEHVRGPCTSKEFTGKGDDDDGDGVSPCFAVVQESEVGLESREDKVLSGSGRAGWASMGHQSLSSRIGRDDPCKPKAGLTMGKKINPMRSSSLSVTLVAKLCSWGMMILRRQIETGRSISFGLTHVKGTRTHPTRNPPKMGCTPMISLQPRRTDVSSSAHFPRPAGQTPDEG